MIERVALSPDTLSLLRAAPANYLILLPDAPRFTIVAATDAYLQATFTEQEGIVGKGLFEAFFDGASLPGAGVEHSLRASLTSVLTHRRPHRMASQRFDLLDPRSGAYTHKLWSPLNTPVLDSTDQVQYIIHWVEDVIQREESREPIRPSDETIPSGDALLMATLDSSLAMIQVFCAVRDDNGKIIDFVWLLNNHQSEEIYGDVIGKRLRECNPGVVEAGIFDSFVQVVETGQPQQYEKHYVHEQFSGWYYQSVVKLGDGVATTTRDITGLREAEQETERQKTLLESIINAPNMGVAVYEAVRNGEGMITDFRIAMANRHTMELWGGRDLTGRRLLEEFPGNAELLETYSRVVDTGTMNQHEIYYTHKGYDHWFLVSEVKFGDGLIINWQDITEKKIAEQELLRVKEELAKRAVDKYETLFNSIEDGFSILELVYDDQGTLIDFIYRETNPAFFRQVGMDLKGKRRSDVFPEKEDFLLGKFERIATTGEPLQFEYVVNSLGDQWFQLSVSRIGGEGSKWLAVVFRNTTERKLAEEALRESEDRQAYLLKLSDALRPLTDPVEVQSTAARILGEHLDSDRAYYVEISEASREFIVARDWHRPGAPSHARRYPLKDWPMPWLVDGKTWVVRDVDTDPSIPDDQRSSYRGNDIGAAVVVPLVKNERLVATFVTNQQVPRPWTQGDITLVEETAERTWAAVERARAEEALHDAGEAYRLQLENEVQQRTQELEESKEALQKEHYFLEQVTDKSPHLIYVFDLDEQRSRISISA